MMKYVVLCALVAGMFITSSCLKGSSSSNTCSYDPCGSKAPDSQVVRLQKYISDSNITAVKHCSGLFYTIVSEGSGGSPTPCSAVAVNYTGTFADRVSVFDKSASPVVFSLLSVIQGWTNGVPLIKKGGKIRLYVPPALGYGNSDYGTPGHVIPGNSILIFDIELLDFQ